MSLKFNRIEIKQMLFMPAKTGIKTMGSRYTNLFRIATDNKLG
jgi:hypothetical protein